MAAAQRLRVQLPIDHCTKRRMLGTAADRDGCEHEQDRHDCPDGRAGSADHWLRDNRVEEHCPNAEPGYHTVPASAVVIPKGASRGQVHDHERRREI